MQRIEARKENLSLLMYGLLLPAVGGTIFWYFIQHVAAGHVVHVVTSGVMVYYFCLHFLVGQQIDPAHYGLSGFGLDMLAVVALEGLFYAVDGHPDFLELGLASIAVILLILMIWTAKAARSHGFRGTFNYVTLTVAIALVGLTWALTYLIDELTVEISTLFSCVILAVASTACLVFGSGGAEAARPAG